MLRFVTPRFVNRFLDNEKVTNRVRKGQSFSFVERLSLFLLIWYILQSVSLFFTRFVTFKLKSFIFPIRHFLPDLSTLFLATKCDKSEDALSLIRLIIPKRESI